ncbi:uncharacterized protein LOC8082407 [Sorghum bicolor]|uniref:uncharacterized protein LOC8082407 n=1 Tax=Sorghum bicolor TaxID=4558 RepID=UPI000B425E12|nr:uncharacterized protein LOC8082407 [Sorghum bicolor]|eukprot:XP_021312481.1 uncharacterized protein LOC8082407 [Sorghum bicolor]
MTPNPRNKRRYNPRPDIPETLLKLKTPARRSIAGAVRVHEERRAADRPRRHRLRRRPQVRARGELPPPPRRRRPFLLQKFRSFSICSWFNSPGNATAQLLGVDPLQAGNVVQLLVVLGMTVGWISTYMFRVANKDMTYAHQLRDYEKQVMEKRLESLTEAELQALLEQVEEEKQRMPPVPEEPNAITFKKK